MTCKEYRQNIASKLKTYRLEHEWSLETMSQIIGISANGLWAIENGKVVPQELTVHKILKTLPDLLENAA